MSLGGQPSLKRLGVMVVAFAMITAAGLGSYVVTSDSQPKTATSVEGGSVYRLTLVQTMNGEWNSSLAQPKFYVLGPDGLESSANIVLPVKTLIQLTIVSYDTPTPDSDDSMGAVNGTVGGNVYLINGTVASMGDMPQEWGKNVTSVPGVALAHTFTIQQLGVNIPVVGGDTVFSYLYFTKSGVFTWLCLPPCGFGPDGMDGAMSASGWMNGQITVR